MERQQQDTRSALRHQTFSKSHYPLTSHQTSTQITGTKRLFSNRGSRIADASGGHGENTPFNEGTQNSPSGKRHRTSDWPLTNTSPPHTSSARPPLRSRNAPNSPNLCRSSASVPRPSKFLEGSMNDRVSHKPPEPYIGQDEELLAMYERGAGPSGKKTMTMPPKFTHHPNISVAESAVSKEQDVSRSSGIFRFGKSLAASFNPTNWKIWQKPLEVEAPELRVLRERKEKAERMYQELKASGMFRDATIGQQSYYDLAGQLSENSATAKHDSGIQLSCEGRYFDGLDGTSKADKRMGKVFLEPPRYASPHAPESIASNSAEDKYQYVKKPSSSNVKNSESPVGHLSSTEHTARRIPSRKDMQKQQKLVKRVSNLECKLDAARRQLAEALASQSTSQHSPKAGRSRFVPGGLASLPSERLLSAHARYEGGLYDERGYEGIGKAVTTDETMVKGPVAAGARMNSMEPDLDKPLPPIRPKSHHADHLIRSVETDDVEDESDEPNVKAISTANTHQAVAEQDPTSSQSDVIWDEEEEFEQDEPTPKLQPVLRKRKTTVIERTADDSGIYKPSKTPNDDSTDERDSAPRKFQFKKPINIARPRKLQKIDQKQAGSSGSPIKESASSPDIKITAQNHRQPASRYQGNSSKTNHAPAATPHKPQLVKPKHPARQSASPPPSSSFTGVTQHISSTTMNMNLKENYRLTSTHSSANHTIKSTNSEQPTETTPPVPHLTQTMRIATREVQTTAASPASPVRNGSKITKTRRGLSHKDESCERRMQVGSVSVVREEFEWDEDVF